MTKEEQLRQLVEKNLRRNPKPMIDTEMGLAALQSVVRVAESQDVSWALIGGIAMHLYGSQRLTNDVDVIASATLPLRGEKRLGFGGERYRLAFGSAKH